MYARLLNIGVIAALVLAAAYVYDIKYESTLRAERVATLRGEIRAQRDGIAALRAEWAQLSNPRRIQTLAQRHLSLKPIVATQFDGFDRLPERAPQIVQPPSEDPIGAMLDDPDGPDAATGAIPEPPRGASDRQGR
jgi:cell division protein FtsL